MTDKEKRSEHAAMQLRLKPVIGFMLDDLAVKMGTTKTGVITIALRELAKQEGVTERKEAVSNE